MKKVISTICLLYSMSVFAQGTKIVFEYDENGNRTKRQVIQLRVQPNNPTVDEQAAELVYTEISDKEEAETSIALLSDQIKLYPNPTRGVISIEGLQTEGVIQLSMKDVNGRIMQDLVLQPNQLVQINLLNEPNGNYFLQLKSSNNLETVTIIKSE